MQEFLSYQVSDVMAPRPKTLESNATIAEAQDLFETYGFNAIPIVDAEGRLQGLLTQFDVLKAFRLTDPERCPPYEEIAESEVGPHVTKDVETLGPKELLTTVLEKMIELRRNSLPVVEDGTLVGMISRQDLVYALRLAAGIEPPRHQD
jgi:CBS domain-containing protein